jgi:catechol 2,3-dioxygenase-like lactoylglutathione lyase family enzyme
MAVTGLNHVNFHCERDLLDRMRAFYRDVIGLTDGPRPPFRNFGYWLYARDQPVMHLWEPDPGIPRNLGTPPTTFDHFAFTAENSAEVEAHFGTLGVEFRMTYLPNSTVKQIFLTDPAGNLVELQFAGG